MTHVVVSGLPGAGKSEVAGPLARALGIPMLAKDPVKEALWDSLGEGDLDWSRLLGRAANEVIVSVGAAMPASVLESFWRHEWAPEALAVLRGLLIEVFCACPLEEAKRRYTERARHPAHLDAPRVADPGLWGEVRNVPLFDGALVVDTTAPVDVPSLAATIRAQPAWTTPMAPMGPALVVVSGLPGTGKSTVAEALSRATGAPIFARDVVEAALWRAGVGEGVGSGGAAYHLLGTLAGEQLALGHAVILDSVAGYERTRRGWRLLAAAHGAPFVVIECVCSDEQAHRERLSTRRRGIPGWYELTWEHVENVRARYEPWSEPRIVLDATHSFEGNVKRALMQSGLTRRDGEGRRPSVRRPGRTTRWRGRRG